MKRCPQCRTDYFDNMLEFCLDDGARLQSVSKPTTSPTKPPTTAADSVETVFYERAGAGQAPPTIAVEEAAPLAGRAGEEPQPIASLKQKAAEKGSRALEISAIALALAHNWWQWLYVARESSGSIAAFLLSAEFLIWFLLLGGGAASGLLALKFSRGKALAYVSLIVLAINFLLVLVPRR